MNGIKRFIGKLIWDFAETFHISLGNLGPTIFGWMVGVKGKRIAQRHMDKEAQIAKWNAEREAQE